MTGFAAMVVLRRAEALNAAGRSPMPLLAVVLGLDIITVLALIAGMVCVPDPTSHANIALRFVLLTYCAVHAGVAALLALHAVLRNRGGFISSVRATDMRITGAWTDYTALAQLPAWAILLLLAGGARRSRDSGRC